MRKSNSNSIPTIIYIDQPGQTWIGATPEPATFWLAGLAGAGALGRRRRSAC